MLLKHCRRHAATILLFLGLLAHPALTTSALAQTETRPSYQLRTSIDLERASIDVQQVVTYTNWTGQPLSSVVLRLPAATVGRVSLNRAEIEGKGGPGQLNETIVEIPVPSGILPRERIRVALDYTVVLPRQPGRLAVTNRSVTLGNWYATLSAHRGDWDRRPYTDVGDAFFTEVADYQVEVETAQPMELAFTGQLVRREGTRWWIDAQNVRDFAIVGSASFATAQTTVGNTLVSAYALSTPPDLLASTAAEMLEWYSARFGPYPYPELKAVEADLPASFGGMEYPGLIMLSHQYGTLRRGSPYDALIAHEIAHQWFYSLVGNDQIDDAWLDEGLATYAPVLFYVDVAPAIGQAQLRQVEAARVSRPLDTSLYAFSDDGTYFGAIYRPGARLLNELRSALGAETFDAAIREYVTLHSHRIATPRAFLDLLQRRTTANLNPIIQRYVNYGAFSYPAPQAWAIRLPGPRLATASELTLEAEFPIGLTEIWLDGQRLIRQDLGGERSAQFRLNLSESQPGERVLLARVWNHEGAQFEYATRVSVRGEGVTPGDVQPNR